MCEKRHNRESDPGNKPSTGQQSLKYLFIDDISDMTSEVGIDDANRHLDMASSIGTYTTHACSTFDEARSDKENSDRHCDGFKQIRPKEDKDRCKAFTINESENANDADSSILSADFEDNDFDALVGEFFWYLREKGGIKMTPRKQSKYFVTIPERTPRAIGSGKVLTPKNSEQAEAHNPSARSKTLVQSEDIVDGSEKVDYQKENVTRRPSVVFKGLENEDKQVTARPIKDQGNGSDYEESDAKVDTSVQKESTSHYIGEKISSKRLGIMPDSPSYNEEEESEESSEGSSVFDTPGLNAAMYTQNTIELEGSPSKDLKEISGRNKVEENLPNLDENVSLSASKSKSHEDNQVAGEPKMTPLRDDSWNEVWIRKGLMGRRPTPLKNMSSRIDECTHSTQDAAPGNSSGNNDNLAAQPPCKILTWPPPKSKALSPVRSPSQSYVQAINFQGASRTMTAEGNDEDSQEFDAEVELSRILDDDSSVHSMNSRNDLQCESSDDMSDAGWEVNRILDDSPCVKRIMSRTRDFIIERQKRALNDNIGSVQANASKKVVQTSTDLDSPKVATMDKMRPLLPKDISIRIDHNQENVGREPDSSFATPSPYAVVTGTASILFDSLTSNSVSGRDSPSNIVSHDIAISFERCLDPDGILMDDKSDSSTQPPQSSLSPRPTEPLQLDTSTGNQGNGSVASDIVQTTKTLDTPTMEPRLSFDDPRPDDSCTRDTAESPSMTESSRNTAGSFEALSISDIAKKADSLPRPSHSNVTFNTSVGFESPPPRESTMVESSVKLSSTSLNLPESRLLFDVDISSVSRQLSDPSDDDLPRSTTSSESSYSFIVPLPNHDSGTEECVTNSPIQEDQTRITKTNMLCDSPSVLESPTEESSLSTTASSSVSAANSNQPSEGPASPPQPLVLPTAPSHETNIPVKPSDEQSDAVAATPEPKTSSVRKPSSKFANILSQWKEKSDLKPNGHFLSPPTNDTALHHPTPQFRSQTPLRRKSTGQVRAAEFKQESSLPKWTPSHTSARPRSIDISSISIPNKSVTPQKRPQNTSAETSAQKTIKYWNGMIRKEDAPQDSWAARAVGQRESSEEANLMLTFPKADSSASLDLTNNTSLVSAIDDDDVPCTCTESAFSGNDELKEFFLPKLGMAHTCGKRNPPILIDSDPIGLHHILRPWQVEFLRSCDIYRGDQLVKACKNRAGSLAGAMHKWRLDHGMSCPRSVSCGMALHIWSRTCKYYVRTIRRQMADGMVEVEPPTLEDVMTTCQSKTESSFEGGE